MLFEKQLNTYLNLVEKQEFFPEAFFFDENKNKPEVFVKVITTHFKKFIWWGQF